jgi:hypothetical protein
MKNLVGERRAIASAVLAFYAFFYLLLSLAAPAGLGPMCAALASVYGLAFFGLVAGYFWARWYASGVLLFGVAEGAMGLWQLGAEPVVMFLLATHGLAALLLWGSAMSDAFDGQDSWRRRFSMDESAANRLGNAVTRVGVSLPMVLIYALAPKNPSEMALLSLALVGAGTWGLMRMRTWGLLSLGAGAAVLATSALLQPQAIAPSGAGLTSIPAVAPLLAVVLLSCAVAPFVPALARALFRPVRATPAAPAAR